MNNGNLKGVLPVHAHIAFESLVVGVYACLVLVNLRVHVTHVEVHGCHVRVVLSTGDFEDEKSSVHEVKGFLEHADCLVVHGKAGEGVRELRVQLAKDISVNDTGFCLKVD